MIARLAASATVSDFMVSSPVVFVGAWFEGFLLSGLEGACKAKAGEEDG
jgi:hypothetical protein